MILSARHDETCSGRRFICRPEDVLALKVRRLLWDDHGFNNTLRFDFPKCCTDFAQFVAM